MKAGDLVKLYMHAGCYHILKMFRNEFGGLRCKILCLSTGTVSVHRPSHLKVLN